MTTAYSEVEIGSSPAQVREVFLDFAKFPEWTHGSIDFIRPVSQKPTVDKGDKLQVSVGGITFHPTVLLNSPEEFKWRGDLYGLFVGEHSFRFEPSKSTAGATTFVNTEQFSGILALLMHLPFGKSDKPKPGFEKFNDDLKRRMESLR